MKTILDQIIEKKKIEVEFLKKKYSYKDFEQFPDFGKSTFSITDSLQQSDFGIIAELKRKSPSAGTINQNLNISQTSNDYENAGVAAISCLTDMYYFGGSNEDLKLVKSSCNLPVLRKEFIIDEIQIFESKAIGADCILLIAEILDYSKALNFTIIAQSLGLQVIMELHNGSEIKKLNDQVDVIGINNRDLKLQETNLQTSFNLKPYLPSDKIIISESGIKTSDEIDQLKSAGFAGALIGESILSKNNNEEFMSNLKSLVC